MNDVATRVNDDGTNDENQARDDDRLETVESYETDDGVVFYDAENPLAWVETTRTLSLEELA